jgi:hypothetical protein
MNPNKRAGLKAIRTERGFALFEEATNRLIGVTPEILWVWLLCDGKKSTKQIAEEIASEARITGASVEGVEKDVKKIVDLLKQNNLLED